MKIRLAQEFDLPQLKAISEAAASAAQWSQPQWLAIFHTQTPARLAWIAEDGFAEDGFAENGFAENEFAPDELAPHEPAHDKLAAVRLPHNSIADEVALRGIGFAVAQNGGPEWELENIAVLPAFRRQGVGRSLLSALLSHARALQAERILLEVRGSNRSAIALYTASGFQTLARRRDYFRNPPEDALILVHTFPN